MNKNRKLQKTIAVTLCIVSVAGNVYSVQAADTVEKDENIYVDLNQDGSVDHVYVVNEFLLDEDAEIHDYGDYSMVKNLTTEEEIQAHDGKISVKAPKGKFFYQGELNHAVLPWDICIRYYLDGKQVNAEELAGKNGRLEIEIEVKENPDAKGEFFDHYLMQETLTLDTEKCSNIVAEDATQANVGKQRQLLYTIMAGQEKEFSISADITDFEMAAISFQAVPMSFGIDKDSLEMDSLTEKTDEIKEAATDFDDGAKELDDGAGELLDGTGELKDGAGELNDGAGELYSGTSDLVSGANALSSGASSLNSGLKELAGGISSLNKGISGVNSGASSLKKGAKELSSGAQAAVAGSQALKEGTDTLSGSLGQLLEGAGELQSGINTLYEQSPQLVTGSSGVLSALKQIQASLASIEAGSGQMQTMLEASGQIYGSIQNMNELAQQVSDGLNALDGDPGSGGTEDGTAAQKSQNESDAAYLESLADTAESLYNSLPGELMSKYAGGINVSSSIQNVRNVAANLRANNDALDAARQADGASWKTADTESLQAAAEQLSDGMNELSALYEGFNSQIQNFPVLLNQMIVTEMKPLKTAIDALITQYETLDQGIGAYTEGLAEIKSGYEALYQGIVKVSEGTAELSSGAGTLAEGNKALSDGAGSLYDGTKTLKSGTKQLSSGGKTLGSGTGSAVSGASQLASGASGLADGTYELNSGAGALNSGTSDLYDGVQELYDGITELKDGTGELVDGTGEFVDGTKDIDDEIDEEIDKVLDEMSGKDFKPVSFVSDQNDNIELVQFVMQTNDIAIPEEEEPEVEEETETVWDKLKELF